VETLGLSPSTPKPRGRLRELFWPIIDSDVSARTAAQNAMYVCFVIGVANLSPMLMSGGWLAPVLTCLFFVFAGFGIRSFSWTAALSTLFLYGLGIIFSIVSSGAFFGFIAIILLGLLIGGVRAVSFASRWRTEHPGEDIRREPLDGLSRWQRFFARLPLVFWPWARPLFVAYLALYALLAIVLVNFTLFFRPMSLPTSSMEPTIFQGEQVIVLRSWLMGPVHRGDIVVFPAPWNSSENYIKRIVGLPGDRLHLHNKQVILNGHPLDEPYVEHIAVGANEYRDNFPAGPDETLENAPDPDAARAMLDKDVRDGELIVPRGRYFVLGDNRDNSLDSRYIGLIPENSIVARPAFANGSARGFRSIPRIRIGN